MPKKKDKASGKQGADEKAKAEASAKAEKDALEKEKAALAKEVEAMKKEKAALEAANKKAEADGKADAGEKRSLVDMVAVEPVLHDGERIEPGEPFTCDKKQAARHRKHGTAERV